MDTEGQWEAGQRIEEGHDRPPPVQNDELDADPSYRDRERKNLPENISDIRNARVLFPADELPEIAIVKTGCSVILATEQLNTCN
jgi:hypothetical protein